MDVYYTVLCTLHYLFISLIHSGNCWRRRFEAPQTNGFGAEISAKIQDTTVHSFLSSSYFGSIRNHVAMCAQGSKH